MKNIITCAALAALLGACATQQAPVASTPAATPSAPAQPAPVAHPAPMAGTPVAALPPYKDPSNILYKERSVYFDFDNYTVKPVYANALGAHGKFLATSPVKIHVEGNSDERGGTEYNLALAQKRAEAVKKALVANGAKEAQIEAVSFGKEKPLAAGHDEQSWAKNRRADIVYP